MSTEETRSLLHRWYDEMWIPKNPDLIPELVGPNYVRHEPGGTRTVTAEEYREQSAAVMPQMEIEDFQYRLVAEGDFVTAIGSWRVNGNQQNWVQVFRAEKGKLVETWLSGISADSRWPTLGPS